MAMKKPIDIQLTKEGLENFKKEQQVLIDKRPEVLARLVAAREQGDLSENAGYHAAKDELAYIDHRIRELKFLLRFADVIETNQTGVVAFGSVVTISDGQRNMVYTIVGKLEANPAKGKLSDVSPIGKMLIGKKVGESVKVDIPDGNITYKVISIS
jgi:transcription elongation factor GreA